MDERRKHSRTEVDEPGYISGDGSSTRCRVINISVEGAALEVPNASYVPGRFQLKTEKDRVIRQCRIVWIQQAKISVVFEQTLNSSVGRLVRHCEGTDSGLVVPARIRPIPQHNDL